MDLDLKRVIMVLARNTRTEPGETRDSAWIWVPHPLTPEDSQSIPDDELLTINQLGPVGLATLRAAYPYNGERRRLTSEAEQEQRGAAGGEES